MITQIEKRSVLKEYFGYQKFRPSQEKIIDSVLQGNDNLVIMPTGGGKSICYQIPALLLEGITIVISPLIALMKDQVDGLVANGIEANFFNSTQSLEAQQELFNALENDKLKLLYVAPESLSQLDGIINDKKVSLIAIDEAHCISAWGHDFRPAYTQLSYLKKRFVNTPIIALTATADKATRSDIKSQLNINNAVEHISSFDRPNLSLEVRSGTNRMAQILDFIYQRPNQSGIIYCLSRKITENLAKKLQEKGILAKAYHAGMEFDQRAQTQEDFINDKTEIICATVAFGMGIDKSNVRWVIHYNLPKNIEGYYQEIGRAGRDGLESETLLFYSYADVIQLQKFVDNSENQTVQLSKLERMKQYAEALSCRRKTLLSYFGEIPDKDCGNCDICKNPPKIFDGSIIAQKALSNVARLHQKEPLKTIIDVLRGSQNNYILDQKYNKLKTFGIAKDISWQNWQQYIIQLLNQGLLEIAFHEKNNLKLTELSKKVLFEKTKVSLAYPNITVPSQASKVSNGKSNIKRDTLFERLRKLRLELSRKHGIPAYRIFSDTTLKEIEKVRPVTDEEFLSIDGVGKKKMEIYGYAFGKEIIKFQKDKEVLKPKKVPTEQHTLSLYNKGLSIEEMAQTRNLSETTIYNHLILLYEQGRAINLRKFITAKELLEIEKAKIKLKAPKELKPYFMYFKECKSYNTIKLGLFILKI